jgi:hypothetical protein
LFVTNFALLLRLWKIKWIAMQFFSKQKYADAYCKKKTKRLSNTPALSFTIKFFRGKKVEKNWRDRERWMKKNRWVKKKFKLFSLAQKMFLGSTRILFEIFNPIVSYDRILCCAHLQPNFWSCDTIRTASISVVRHIFGRTTQFCDITCT